jgi:hypothetical protein
MGRNQLKTPGNPPAATLCGMTDQTELAQACRGKATAAQHEVTRGSDGRRTASLVVLSASHSSLNCQC